MADWHEPPPPENPVQVVLLLLGVPMLIIVGLALVRAFL